MKYLQTKHEQNSAKITALIVVIFVLLCFVVGQDYQDLPEEYGVAINFGDVSVVSDNTSPNTSAKVQESELELEESEEVLEETVEEEVVEEDSLEEEIEEAALQAKQVEEAAEKQKLEEEAEKQEIEKAAEAAVEEAKTKSEEAAKAAEAEKLLAQEQEEALKVENEKEAKESKKAKEKEAKSKADKVAAEKKADEAKASVEKAAKAKAEAKAKAKKAEADKIAKAKATADAAVKAKAQKVVAAKAASDKVASDKAAVAAAKKKSEGSKSVSFKLVENSPIYPGCESGNNSARKKCMNDKINQFIAKNFNTILISDLSLSGKQEIFIRFTINQSGNITGIKVKGPHAQLEEEAERVIKLLPKMKPGIQQGRPVSVSFNLPISVNGN